MKSSIAAALVAGLLLTGCATGGAPSARSVLDVVSSAQIAFQTAATIVDQDTQAGLITGATAIKVKAGLTAASEALSAAESAYAAGNDTDAKQKSADVMAALVQVNAALLTVATAAR